MSFMTETDKATHVAIRQQTASELSDSAKDTRSTTLTHLADGMSWFDAYIDVTSRLDDDVNVDLQQSMEIHRLALLGDYNMRFEKRRLDITFESN